MNKMFTIISLVLFVTAIAVPAIAVDNGNCSSCNDSMTKSSVQVNADIEISKNKKVMEDIAINKLYKVDVHQDVKPTNSAEAQAVKEDHNMNNKVSEEPGEKKIDPVKTYIETEALNYSSGIIGVNQSPGNLNNQGNATSVSMTDDNDAFIHAESSVTKINEGNSLESYDPVKKNEIENAAKNVSGIAGINQSAGHMNNQNNAVSLSVGKNSVAALSEADLGMVNANNVSHEINAHKIDILEEGAFCNANGIISVNQSAGSMNNQANVVAASVTMNNFD